MRLPKNGALWGAIALIVLVIAVVLLRPANDGSDGEEASDEAVAAPAKRIREPRPANSARPGEEDAPRFSADPTSASDAVASILDDSSLSDEEVRDRLLQHAGSNEAPLEERSEALDHAFRLTIGEDMAPILALASSRSLAPELRSQMLDEAMDFPGKDRLRVLGALLEQAKGEQQEEILDELRFFTGEDHGQDLAAWNATIEAYEPQAGPPER